MARQITRRGAATAVTALVLGSVMGGPVAAERHTPWWTGTWSAVPGACAPEDETRIVLTPQAITFYESQCSLTPRSPGDAQDGAAGPVALEAACAGEGETWTVALDLARGQDGSLLLQGLSDDGRPVHYRRCAQ